MMRVNMKKVGTSLDRIARDLAAQAGVAWNELGDYPGYIKNVWRDEAKRTVIQIFPNATIRPGRVLWDGSVEESAVFDFGTSSFRS